MKDKQFEQIFKDALEKYEAPYQAENWAAMEKMLDAKPNNYMLLKAGEIVLVCLAVWFIANPFIQSKLDDMNVTSAMEAIEEVPNDVNDQSAIIPLETVEDEEQLDKNAIHSQQEQIEAIEVVVEQPEKIIDRVNTVNASNRKNQLSFDHQPDVSAVNSNPAIAQHITISSQLAKDMADFREHVANQDLYALNVAFNINGETYSEEEKAWIVADINVRSANSMTRIQEVSGLENPLDNAFDSIEELEAASLKPRSVSFIQDVGQNMIYGIEYAPDVPTNSYSSNYQVGNTFGFNMKYEVNENIRLITGAHYYSFKMENPGFCMNDVNGFTGEVLINSDESISSQVLNNQTTITSSDCFSHSRHYKRQIEIPFEADIQLNDFGAFSMYLNSGISMYLINREYFDYQLVDNDIQLRDSGDFTELLNGLQGPEASQFRLFEKDEVGHVKIGLGLEYKLQPAVGIRLQPQLKIPVSFEDGFSSNLMRYSVATGLYYHF